MQPIFNFRETVLFLSMFIFVTGGSWALYWLADHMEFSSFMIFGGLTLAIMVSLGFAYDHWSARRSQR